MTVLSKVISKKKAFKSILAVSLAASMFICGCGAENKSAVSDSVSAVSDSISASSGEEVTISVSEEIITTTTSEVSEENITTTTSEVSEAKEEKSKVINVVATKRDIPDNEALSFVKGLGAGISLGNTFDANDTNNEKGWDLEYETYWQSATTTKEVIDGLRDGGITTLRLPVSWHNHVDENFVISEAWLNRVKEVVDWAIEDGMYVILNIHHDNEKKYMYPKYEYLDNSKAYVTAIWSQLATTFGDYDEHLIFETLNEPRLKGTSEEWWVDVKSDLGKETTDCINQYNQVIVDTIRQTEGKYNSSRYILCPAYCAASEFALDDSFVLPADNYATKENRILVELHAYTPYNFALAEPGSNATDKFSLFSYESTGEIDLFLMKLYNKFIKNGIGVVIDEFGARDRSGNLNARAQFAAYYVATARSYGMSCVWWDNNNVSSSGEAFGIYDRYRCAFRNDDIVTQLTYYGNN